MSEREERGAYLTRNRAEGLERRIALAEGRMQGRIEALEAQLEREQRRNDQLRTLVLALTHRMREYLTRMEAEKP